jgi:hypothetical protein
VSTGLDDDPHDHIAQLEARIEELAETVERARKYILAARIAMVAGGLVLAAILFGFLRFDPAVMMGAISAVLGGIVVFGSNTSTAQQAAANMREAETLRADLIGRLDLHEVGERLH